MAVGKITDPFQAEHILRTGQADMVALARGITYDSRWAWHAAEALGDPRAAFPPQYARSHPSMQGLPIPGNPPLYLEGVFPQPLKGLPPSLSAVDVGAVGEVVVVFEAHAGV